MRRLRRVAQAERRRVGGLAGEPKSAEEVFAEQPEMEEFVAAHSFEVGELLLKPTGERLSLFAFRRAAAEMAAQGRPVEAGAWLRLVQGVERMQSHLNSAETAFAPADHLRAQYAAQLRAVFEDRLFDAAAAEEADEPDYEGGVAG